MQGKGLAFCGICRWTRSGARRGPSACLAVVVMHYWMHVDSLADVLLSRTQVPTLSDQHMPRKAGWITPMPSSHELARKSASLAVNSDRLFESGTYQNSTIIT